MPDIDAKYEIFVHKNRYSKYQFAVAVPEHHFWYGNSWTEFASKEEAKAAAMRMIAIQFGEIGA